MDNEKSDRRAQRRFRSARLTVLVVALIASTALGILHQKAQNTRPVSVDALDPFGGIESAITLAITGTMLSKIALSSFILLAATLVTALVFRRAFCGNLCAFGALQELAGRLGRAIFRKRLVVPAAIDRPARYLKYVVLVAIVALSAITGQLIIRPYDPWAAYHHILNAELLTGFLVGLILLVVSLVGSVLYDRFFCKYLCPMGGFLGLINRAGWFRVKRNNETCTHCHACDKACPVNIKVETVTQVQSSECINCNLCVAACPVKDTLIIAGPRPAKRGVSPTVVLLITLGIFAAVVGVTTATGGFEWTARPLAATVATGTGESGAATATLNPDDIKGSDTFKQVADLTGIAESAFVEKFVLQKGDFAKPIKDASHREGSGFDVEAVREFVRLKLGK